MSMVPADAVMCSSTMAAMVGAVSPLCSLLAAEELRLCFAKLAARHAIRQSRVDNCAGDASALTELET